LLSKSVFFYVLIIGFFFFGLCLIQASDTSELEGTWKDLHQGWSLEFNGNQIKIKSPNPQLCMEGTFTSDPAADPKEIDIKIKKSAGPQYQGLTSLGIYKIDNIMLTLALGEPGNKTRPQTFSTSSGAMVIAVTKLK
jgi:uncharacterized protein (TIGR03067 family)